MLNDAFTILPAFERNNVPVVIAANNLYAPYAGVFIQSLLDHAREERNYDVIIFQHDISEENQRLIKRLSAGYTSVSIRFYDPSPFFSSINYEDENHRFPIEVYYRIIAPYILKHSGRIITVDTDTLLKADIARLMDEDLGEYSVGGVCDVGMNGMYLCDYTLYGKDVKIKDYFQNVCKLGSDGLKNYVNGGLLLIDRDKFVRELDIETILSIARQGKYIYEEQDILNVSMKGRIKTLDFAWNVGVRSTPHSIRIFNAGAKLYDGAYERAYENPYLIHWSARPKPWICPDVPWGGDWWQTALRTPFVGHIIARMMDGLETRRDYFRKRYGKEIDVWDPSPKGVD